MFYLILSFVFFDGVALFDNLDVFRKIKTDIYLDVITKIQPKIVKVAQAKGESYFKKYCFFALRQKLKIETNKNEGKIMTSVIFCFNNQTTDAELLRFFNDYNEKYSSAVTKEEDFNLIQRYRIKQNIFIQYYQGMSPMNYETAPEYFSSFSEEGLVMNQSKELNPATVKQSFRYDQIIDCDGFSAIDLKAAIGKEIADLYRDDSCCISYLTNWDGVGSKIMICSAYKTLWKCQIDIKIIRSTMYDLCMRNKIKDFFAARLQGHPKSTLNLNMIERIGVIDTMFLMRSFNLTTYPTNNTMEYLLYEDQSKVNKEAMTENIIKLDEELSSKKSGGGGCEEYIDKGI